MDKQTQLEEIRRKLQAIGGSDPDDPPIDEGILDTLVVLNAMGINTTMSCEGHVWSDQEDPLDDGPNFGPYVEICSLYGGKFDYDLNHMEEEEKEPQLSDDEWDMLYRRHLQELSVMQEKLLTHLQEFYTARTPTEAIRLVISRPGLNCDVFVLASQGAWIQRSGENHREFLRQSQAELVTFTRFLLERYLAD